MAAPPLIRDIAKHPVLSKVHLIAEPWDLGMYQVRIAWGILGFRQL
jgi:isoamylase